jgi:hypothetical protein
MSSCQAPYWSHHQISVTVVTVVSLWWALSDERSGLSIVSQSQHFLVVCKYIYKYWHFRCLTYKYRVHTLYLRPLSVRDFDFDVSIKIKIKLYCDRRSVDKFVLVSGPFWSIRPDFTFLSVTITFFLLHVGSLLWREDWSVICSAITQVQVKLYCDRWLVGQFVLVSGPQILIFFVWQLLSFFFM